MSSAASGPLTETMAALWPQAVVRARADGARQGTELLAEYAFAPRASRPSLAVPLGSARGTASAVGRFHAGLTPRQVLVRLLATGATRVAPRTVLPDQFEVVGSAQGSLAQHLGQVLGQPVQLALGIGSERVNRKPVVAVLDARGRHLAFAKIGDSAVSVSDVGSEARALRQLDGVTFPEVSVPRLLDFSHWQGKPVLLATALQPRAIQRGRWRSRAPAEAMAQVQRAFAAPRARPEDLPWFAERVAQLQTLQDLEARSEANDCLAVLTARTGVTGEVGAWHGDWTPWNMSAHRSGGRDQFQVWDWERFETGVPGGLDAVHYRVNVATQHHGCTVAVLLRALGPRPGPGESDTAGLYLLAICARYLSLAQGPGGERIAARGRLFLQAWRRRG